MFSHRLRQKCYDETESMKQLIVSVTICLHIALCLSYEQLINTVILERSRFHYDNKNEILVF